MELYWCSRWVGEVDKQTHLTLGFAHQTYVALYPHWARLTSSNLNLESKTPNFFPEPPKVFEPDTCYNQGNYVMKTGMAKQNLAGCYSYTLPFFRVTLY